MTMSKYVIGIDYGTLSGRCVLVDMNSGEEVAESALTRTPTVFARAMR